MDAHTKIQEQVNEAFGRIETHIQELIAMYDEKIEAKDKRTLELVELLKDLKPIENNANIAAAAAAMDLSPLEYVKYVIDMLSKHSEFRFIPVHPEFHAKLTALAEARATTIAELTTTPVATRRLLSLLDNLLL